MINAILIFISSLFVLAASCYLLFITSDILEDVGEKLGHLLHLPEDVIASTFQALATSGPEIVMAILAATPYVAQRIWKGLELGEKACSGTLNLSFSAMDNLLGIGCLGMIYMLYKGTVKKEEVIKVEPSVKIGLIFYILSSLCFSIFVTKGVITVMQAWILMIIGIVFIISQFFIPSWIERRKKEVQNGNEEEDKGENGDGDGDEGEDGSFKGPKNIGEWFKMLLQNGFIYAFLVFALILFVRECINATFNMATVGIVSVGGILCLFTSYVSSFPEFMLTYRYAVAAKKSALLSMLFGSNVIDLAFAGFRAMWLNEPMAVYTTGRFPQLLPIYIWALPVIAVLALIGIWSGKIKYKHAYPLVVFYVIYIITGFILL